VCGREKRMASCPPKRMVNENLRKGGKMSSRKGRGLAAQKKKERRYHSTKTMNREKKE